MNPLAVLNTRRESAYSREFIGSADIDYKVHGFEDLRLHATLGADVAKGTQHRNASPASPQFIYYGSYGYETILKRNLSLSMYAQYFHDFNDKLKNHFDIMGGYECKNSNKPKTTITSVTTHRPSQRTIRTVNHCAILPVLTRLMSLQQRTIWCLSSAEPTGV